jgi:hypothetical protein
VTRSVEKKEVIFVKQKWINNGRLSKSISVLKCKIKFKEKIKRLKNFPTQKTIVFSRSSKLADNK